MRFVYVAEMRCGKDFQSVAYLEEERLWGGLMMEVILGALCMFISCLLLVRGDDLSQAFGQVGLARGSEVAELGPFSFGEVRKFYYDAEKGITWPCGVELPVLSHSGTSSLCKMNHFWIGGSYPGIVSSYIYYYVDGETEASLKIPIGLAHSSSFNDNGHSWSAGSLFGRTGIQGGIFNSFEIPFRRSIIVTVTLDGPIYRSVPVWIILRGIDGTTVPAQGMEIPPHARLRSYDRGPKTLVNGERIALIDSSASHGAVLLTSSLIQAENITSLQFLEGCFRVEDPTTNQVRVVISSGTEDYYLGTYYFQLGSYKMNLAGITEFRYSQAQNDSLMLIQSENSTFSIDRFEFSGFNFTFAAYRVHGAAEPLYFSNGMRFTYRNGDPQGCDLTKIRPGLRPINYHSLSLVYEW